MGSFLLRLSPPKIQLVASQTLETMWLPVGEATRAVLWAHLVV